MKIIAQNNQKCIHTIEFVETYNIQKKKKLTNFAFIQNII